MLVLAFLGHLEFVAEIAAVLGSSSVIFGSPRLRQFTDPLNEAYRKIAVTFLYAATEGFHSQEFFVFGTMLKKISMCFY